MGERDYELRLFDRALVEFSVSDGIFGPEVDVRDWDDASMALMPCGFSPTAEFGILRDNATGRPLRLAPIFDNGRALFPNVADDDANQFLLEAQLHGPAFGGRSFSELVSRVMASGQFDLMGRAVSRGIVGNVLVPSKRVAALDTFVRRHAEELAQIPPVDHGELKAALHVAWGRRPTTSDNAHRLSPS